MWQYTTQWAFRWSVVFFACLWSAPVLAQEALPLQNPLIRPPTLSSEQVSPVDSSTQVKRQKASQPSSDGEASGFDGGGTNDLRAKAAARLTQEDLNVRQQALNAAVVPVPLQQLFNNMYVAAHARGAIVLRRFEARMPRLAQPEADAASTQSRGSTSVSTLAPALSGPSVLRFHEGSVMNISGYRLRARLDGLDVSVDWQNQSGQWVNVFFGALESAPGYSTVPAQAALQKPDKQAFKYLQPKLGVQGAVAGSSPYPGSPNQQGGFSGQGQSNMNGFGTAAPIFPN